MDVGERTLRVLSWNLFHGRALPPLDDARLAGAFSAKLADWEWDLALLQEVPPWWPPRLARDAQASQRTAPTSRNALLALRRLLAERRPELMKSNGGGCNAVLARTEILEARSIRLRRWPERRVAQLVRLAGGICAANYHGSTRVPLAQEELERLWGLALEWAGAAPLVLGGDLNLREPRGAAGAVHVAIRDVDHLFARGLVRVGELELLDRSVELGGARHQLSDHPPLRVSLLAQPAADS